MTDILLIILLVLAAVILVVLLWLAFKKPVGGAEEMLRQNNIHNEALQKSLQTFFSAQNGALSEQTNMLTNFLSNQFKTNTDELSRIETRVNEILKLNDSKLDKLIEKVEKQLQDINEKNEKKLEQMRQTVDEKLSETLQKRLDTSVKIITEQLEKVSKISGEIQAMTQDMGDFKRVLTNVKTRGGWGEVQLENLLEQVLSPSQYSKQVMINPRGREQVDFVINMPGHDGEVVWLPIDAKFPLEDYRRLIDASEKGDLVTLEEQKKNLEKRLIAEAKSIKDKYINVPKTTDFAVLYLPVEGLYAEAVKNNKLCDEFQKHKIMVCGPNTIMALLNSLQMGFRTLAIEKRSGEVWKTLSIFKQEFGKFVGLVEKTQKKLGEASNTIDDVAKKTRTIQTKLRDVSSIEGEKVELLEESEEQDD